MRGWGPCEHMPHQHSGSPSGALPSKVLPLARAPQMPLEQRDPWVCPRTPDPQTFARSQPWSQPGRGEGLGQGADSEEGTVRTHVCPPAKKTVSSVAGGGGQGPGNCLRVGVGSSPTYLPKEGGIPLHAVAAVSSLDFRVKGANHIVQYLHSNVVSPHTGAGAPCVLVCRLKNLKGPKPGGKTQVFNKLKQLHPLAKKEGLDARSQPTEERTH